MPKLHHLTITALRDNVKVVTAVKQLAYRKVEGLKSGPDDLTGGMPEGQPELYEQTHGITLQLDQVIEIDVHDRQLARFQAAVDAGDLDISIAEAATPTVHRQLLPTAKAEPPKSDPPKGDKK